MKPRELFGVAVRVIGLLLVLSGLFNCAKGFWRCLEAPHGIGAGGFLLGGIIFIIAGFILMLGSKNIEKYVYPDDDK